MRIRRRARIVVREPRPTDARGIAQVLVDSWLAAYDELLPAELLAGMSVAERTKQLERALAAPKPDTAVRLVAELQGQVIGFANAGVLAQGARPADGRTIRVRDVAQGAPREPSEVDQDDPRRTGELAVFYVAPDFWRQGVGRKLLRRAISLLAAAGSQDVHAWVVDGNEPALAFFRRQGWTESTARRTEVMDGHLVRQTRLEYRVVD